MKLHELKIKHEYLLEVTMGKKTFELRKNDRDYQVGDLIHFIDIKEGNIRVVSMGLSKDDYCDCDCDVDIDKDALYKITYILKNVPEYGLDKDYCILGIKKLKNKE